MELFETEVWLRQMARLRDFVRKIGPRGFRAVLFRMVPKLELNKVSSCLHSFCESDIVIIVEHLSNFSIVL